ncbi:hypothetical protein NCM_03317 [Burkholderia pseudomallei]
MNSASFTPPPPTNCAFKPSCFICLMKFAASESRPPKKTRSTFLLLRLVICARKSTAWLLVYSRATIAAPAAFTALSNSSASPWPNAVRSSTIAMRLAFVTSTA